MHHPVFAFAGVLLVLEYTSVTTAWPVTVDSSADNFPSIDISLSPPLRPLPKIATHVGSLDAAREASESLMMERVQRAGQQALTRSKANIDKVVKHFMHSFADSSPEKFKAMYMALVADPHQVRNPKKHAVAPSFLSTAVQAKPALASPLTVHVQREAPVDMSVIKDITEVEHQRDKMESHMTEQATAEIEGLVDLVTTELEAQLDIQASAMLNPSGQGAAKTRVKGFLQKTSATTSGGMSSDSHQLMANVHVVPAEIPFPTIDSLVQDMEKRRNVAETLEQNKIAKTKLLVLQAANAVAKRALDNAVVQLIAHMSPTSR